MHELGHVLSALFLKLKISSVGIAAYPYPHPYVKVAYSDVSWKRYLFFYSGAGMTLLLFILAIFIGIFEYKMIYFAFAIELIIEFNPFYSDFLLVNAKSQRDYYVLNTSFEGSKKYLLFFWIVLIIILLHPKGLQTWLNIG
ncbi:hypothetical protein [Maribacter sp. IgM3_T14_3]|uniref:hypothetical protein n=1 Tax=Maribacter sp. IgM3_T14_3 TaxID=3415140 RepID=UPI003C6F52C6